MSARFPLCRQIVGWTLLPVVVAVLLDSFVSATASWKLRALERDEELRLQQKGLSKADAESPIAPLLDHLVRFADKARSPCAPGPAPVVAPRACAGGACTGVYGSERARAAFPVRSALSGARRRIRYPARWKQEPPRAILRRSVRSRGHRLRRKSAGGSFEERGAR